MPPPDNIDDTLGDIVSFPSEKQFELTALARRFVFAGFEIHYRVSLITSCVLHRLIPN